MAVAWAALSTDPISHEHTAPGDQGVDWYRLYISDTAQLANIFSYIVNPGAGQFGDDTVSLYAHRNGIYTFSLQMHTSDMTAPGDLRIQPVLSPGKYMFGFEFFATVFLWADESWTLTDIAADDYRRTYTYTVPIWNDSPTARNIGGFSFAYSNTVDEFWKIDLWVTYYGDINWDGAHKSFTVSDANWNSFDGHVWGQAPE
jgi:hypothetical protein